MDPAPILPPPIPYPGSKRRLVPAILRILPKHDLYVEPFIGGGSVFFGKPPAKKSVIADLDAGLVRFYKNFQCDAIADCGKIKNVCSFTQASFPKLRDQKADLCETIAARRFSVVSAGHGLKRDECKVRPLLPKKLSDPTSCAAYEAALSRATVEHGDWKTVASKHDSKDTLTYLDPPYHGDISREYVPGKREIVTPEEICEFARKAKGKVLVSYNDHPDVRQACKGLQIRSIITHYGMRRTTKGKPRARELLIANFPLPAEIPTGMKGILLR